MSSNGEKAGIRSHRTQIIVALIGLVGVLGAALIANWDKVFVPKTHEELPRPPLPPKRDNGPLTNVRVRVYYWIGRDQDAEMMKKRLVTHGAKAEDVEKRLPTNRDAGVVYYQHRDKLQAARAVVKLFPEMELEVKFEDTARTIYEEDVYLFLQ